MLICGIVRREYFAASAHGYTPTNACGGRVATSVCQGGHMKNEEEQKTDRQTGRTSSGQREMKTDGWEGELAWAPICTLHAQFDLLYFPPSLSHFSFFLRLLLFAPFSVIPFHVTQGTNKSEEGLPPDTSADSYLSISFCPSACRSLFLHISLSQPWLANHEVCSFISTATI